MDAAHAVLMNDRDTEITAAVLRERAKLLPEPIEQAAAWLFRVARNRVIDRFRKNRSLPATETLSHSNIDESDYWLDLALPPIDTGPEAMYARSAVLMTLQQALDELPAEQREVFVAHELDGQRFKDIAARTGVAVNTLLARKRYAVLNLRARLRTAYAEWDL
jgi:RNA polymerase sigma factor (sigma-70 family)